VGLIKGMLFVAGVPVRPTTTRERSRGYQRKANRLQEEANYHHNEANSLLEEQIRSLQAMNQKLQVSKGSPRTGVAHSSTSAASGMPEKLDLLIRIHQLKEDGVLSDEEYQSQKQLIINALD
jgi:hypothetical protein